MPPTSPVSLYLLEAVRISSRSDVDVVLLSFPKHVRLVIGVKHIFNRAQVPSMKNPVHPILTTDKMESLMTALTGEGPFRSNVDRDRGQLSLLTLPIGHFHELALP